MGPPRLAPYWFLRDGGGETGVEEAAGVQIAVAEELVHRSVEGVGARFGDSVDGAAITAILRAVGAGQGLKFGDRLNAQRRTSDVRAGVALPPVQNIFTIQ